MGDGNLLPGMERFLYHATLGVLILLIVGVVTLPMFASLVGLLPVFEAIQFEHWPRSVQIVGISVGSLFCIIEMKWLIRAVQREKAAKKAKKMK